MAIPRRGAMSTTLFLAITTELIVVLSCAAVEARKEITKGSENSPKHGEFIYWGNLKLAEEGVDAVKKNGEGSYDDQFELHLLKEQHQSPKPADNYFTWSYEHHRYFGAKENDGVLSSDSDQPSSPTNMEEEKKKENCQCQCPSTTTNALDAEKMKKDDKNVDSKTLTGDQKNVVVPQIDTRHIIGDPSSSIVPKCPPGYRYEKGKCRFVEP